MTSSRFPGPSPVPPAPRTTDLAARTRPAPASESVAAGDTDLRRLLSAEDRAESRRVLRRAGASLTLAALALAALLVGIVLPVPLPAAAVAAGVGLTVSRFLAPAGPWARVRGDWVVVAGLRGYRGVRLSRLDPTRVTGAADLQVLHLADREGRRLVVPRPPGQVVHAVAEALPSSHPLPRRVLREGR